MEKSLHRLLAARYKNLLIGIVLIISGVYAIQTINSISSWKQTYHYYQTQESIKDFDTQIKDSYEFNDEQKGKVFLYYDLKKEKAYYTDNYDQYKQYVLTIFSHESDSSRLPFNAYDFYNEHFLLVFSILVIVGFSLFMFDLKTNFNTLLFSSKYTRSSIYWQKYWLVGGTLFITLLIAKSVTFLSYQIFIPSTYLNISVYQHITSTFSGLILLMSGFIVSSFIGLMMGEWMSASFTLLGLFLSFNLFIGNINQAATELFAKNQTEPANIVISSVEKIIPVSQTSLKPINILLLLFIVVLSGMILVAGQLIYQHISLEENGNYLLLPQLKRPVQILFMLYCLITINLPNIMAVSNSEETLTLIETTKPFFQLSVTIFVSYLVSEFVLYKKMPKFMSKLNEF
ncbi:MAG: hypothetical protein ACTJHZ_07680 [Vagococcus sp.]